MQYLFNINVCEGPISATRKSGSSSANAELDGLLERVLGLEGGVGAGVLNFGFEAKIGEMLISNYFSDN